MSRLDELFGKETLRTQLAWRVLPLPWWHWRSILAWVGGWFHDKKEAFHRWLDIVWPQP